MNRTICTSALFVLAAMALIGTAPVFAGPFHDCTAQPAAVEGPVHTEHGTKCGNSDGTSGTWAQCNAGCDGTACPGGEWYTDQACHPITGYGGVDCSVQGNIVCNGRARTYQMNCFPANGNTKVVVTSDRTQVTCSDYWGSPIICDCNSSAGYWSAYCGG